jgi:very-short-patch-repair endonuclease
VISGIPVTTVPRTVLTRKELEARFRAFVRSTGLPLPRFSANVQGYECDCVWPDHAFIVELDGRAVHDTTAAFERDRERDRVLIAAGWRVIRITWRQLHQTRERVPWISNVCSSGKKHT